LARSALRPQLHGPWPPSLPKRQQQATATTAGVLTRNDDGGIVTAARRRRVERRVTLVDAGVVDGDFRQVDGVIGEVERVGGRNASIHSPRVVDGGRRRQSVAGNVEGDGRTVEDQGGAESDRRRLRFYRENCAKTHPNLRESDTMWHLIACTV